MALVRLMRFDDDRVTGEQDRASSPTIATACREG